VFESLEPRTLLSAAALDAVTAQPAFTGPYQPSELSQAYGFNNIVVNGIAGTGGGQTIAIVDAYDDPNITTDLATFDKQFGLAAPPSFKKVELTSGYRALQSNSGWDMEISLDVEWAHAIAPKANILLVEASSASLSSLLSAVSYASGQPGVSVVSMSWGAGEFSGETTYDNYFTTPGVTFVAASGDSGGLAGWPAVSPDVVAVGGTTLTTTASTSGKTTTYAYAGETAWSGSSGGPSAYETEPVYQTGVQKTGWRTAPDVSLNADPNTGDLVYDSVPYDGQRGWWIVGGTSASTPVFGALVAIADQERVAAKLAPLSQTPADLYSIYANQPTTNGPFHDVLHGSNSGYTAGPGYDMVTGLGSPNASVLVADLIGIGANEGYFPPTSSATKHTSGVSSFSWNRGGAWSSWFSTVAGAQGVDALAMAGLTAPAGTPAAGLPQPAAESDQFASGGTLPVSTAPRLSWYPGGDGPQKVTFDADGLTGGSPQADQSGGVSSQPAGWEARAQAVDLLLGLPADGTDDAASDAAPQFEPDAAA